MATGGTDTFGRVLFEAKPATGDFVKKGLLPVLLGCVLAVPYLLFVKNPGGDATGNVFALGLTYLIVAIIVFLAVLNRRVVFQVTETHVVKRRWLRSPVAVRRTEIAEAVLAVHYAVVGTRSPRLFLLDGGTAPLLTADPLHELAQLEALAAAAPTVTRVEVLRPEEAVPRWPRMMPWSHRNQGKAMLLGGGGTIVVLLLAIGLIALLVG